jgi:hypothetical protein
MNRDMFVNKSKILNKASKRYSEEYWDEGSIEDSMKRNHKHTKNLKQKKLLLKFNFGKEYSN